MPNACAIWPSGPGCLRLPYACPTTLPLSTHITAEPANATTTSCHSQVEARIIITVLSKWLLGKVHDKVHDKLLDQVHGASHLGFKIMRVAGKGDLECDSVSRTWDSSTHVFVGI